MAKNTNISGIGSWLAVLIFGMMVLSPLIGIGSLSNELRTAIEKLPQLEQNSQWQTYKQTAWIIFTSSAALSFTAGYRLWKLHIPDSVKFAIYALWIISIGRPFLDGVATIVIFGSNNFSEVFPEMIAAMIPAVITAGIWTAYLKRSVRVKNTYVMYQ